MAKDVNGRGTGTKLWIRVILVVSLALNLLVIGTVGGAMLTKSKWRSHHPPRLDMAAGPLTQALSREDRRAIGSQMRKAYRGGGTSRSGLRAELDGLVADLSATPFDPKAVERRLERHRDIFDERITLGHSLLLDRLAKMPPEDRAAYADRLQEVLERRHRHGHGKRDRE